MLNNLFNKIQCLFKGHVIYYIYDIKPLRKVSYNLDCQRCHKDIWDIHSIRIQKDDYAL